MHRTKAYTSAVSNRGNGAHGNSTGPDALFAQKAIAVSTASNLLAAVNVRIHYYIFNPP